MNINQKPMILCFVFTVLGSTLAFARPIMRSEDGCRLHERKTTACHVPIEPCAVTGRCRFPNAPKDDWPGWLEPSRRDNRLMTRHHVNVVAIGAHERPHILVQANRIDPDKHHWGKAICARMPINFVRRETKKRFRRGHIGLLDQSGP